MNSASVSSEWAKKISFPERVRGWRFRNLVKETVSQRMKKYEEIIEEFRHRIFVNEILWGGRYYSIPEVLYELFEISPKIGYVKIESREKPGEVNPSVKFGKLAFVEDGLLIVGDTVATGETLKTFFGLLPRECSLLLFTIGSEEGVSNALAHFKGEVIGVEYLPSPTGLNPINKTDMPINMKKLPKGIQEKLLAPEWVLERQCIIGDFSDSIGNVEEFIGEWYAIVAQMIRACEIEGLKGERQWLIERGRLLERELRNLGERGLEIARKALERRQRLKGVEREFSFKTLDIVKVSRGLSEEDVSEFLIRC